LQPKIGKPIAHGVRKLLLHQKQTLVQIALARLGFPRVVFLFHLYLSALKNVAGKGPDLCAHFVMHK
jgi:hypothetical protein